MKSIPGRNIDSINNEDSGDFFHEHLEFAVSSKHNVKKAGKGFPAGLHFNDIPYSTYDRNWLASGMRMISREVIIPNCMTLHLDINEVTEWNNVWVARSS